LARVASPESGKKRCNADVFFTKAQYAGDRYVLAIILPIAGVMITATFYNAVHGAHPLTPTGM
jgi:hypothetical protein